MGKKIAFWVGVAVVLVLLDVFARFLYLQSWFGSTSLDTEVDPFDIITLVVTSVLTVWLGWYVAKKVTEQRYQKDYLISDLKEIEDEVRTIETNILSARVDLQEMVSVLTKIRNHINRFSATLEIFGIREIDLVDLNRRFDALYEKTTNTDGDHLILNEANRHEINNVCSGLVVKTRGIIHQINNR